MYVGQHIKISANIVQIFNFHYYKVTYKSVFIVKTFLLKYS